MNVHKLLLVACALTLGLSVRPAFGQRRSFGPALLPNQRPTTSPYLNLLNNNGLGFGFNYFQFVRPQMEFRRNNALLGRSVTSIQQELQQEQTQIQREQGAGLTATGHTATFMNYGGYFPALGGTSGTRLSGGRSTGLRSTSGTTRGYSPRQSSGTTQGYRPRQ